MIFFLIFFEQPTFFKYSPLKTVSSAPGVLEPVDVSSLRYFGGIL